MEASDWPLYAVVKGQGHLPGRGDGPLSFLSSGQAGHEGFVDNSLSRCTDAKRRRTIELVRQVVHRSFCSCGFEWVERGVFLGTLRMSRPENEPVHLAA